jgi:hypothetical protein
LTRDERVVGSIGLYHACCELSRRGWRVSLTRRGWKHISRNIAGVDINLLNESSTRELTIQIMVVLDSAPVPFGNEIDNLSADFVMFCGSIKNDESINYVRPIPDMFIMSKEEIISAATRNNGNYWLNESEYKLHKGKWEKIGFG